MWDTVYKIISDSIISLMILQGTVEKIINGKRTKHDLDFMFTQVSAVAKHMTSVYQFIKVLNNKTRDEMVVLNKWDNDMVGNKIPVSQHAIVEGPFIPIVKKVYDVMDNLVSNGYVKSLYRTQRAFGMYHIGLKMYMGKEMVGSLAVSSEKAYEYISRIAKNLNDGICIAIGETHVGVKLKKDIKKGRLQIVTHPSFVNKEYPQLVEVEVESSGNS